MLQGGAGKTRKNMGYGLLTINQRIRVAGAFIGLALVVSGCTADKKPSGAEKVLANVAKDIVIPFEAEDMKNPVPANPETLSEGKKTYMQSCALCHGTDGHGQTMLGRGMYPPAMDLTSPHVQHWDDGEMYWIIQNGARLTGMPSWKDTISSEDTWKLVHFIRQLPKLNAEQAAAKAGEETVNNTKEQLIEYGKTLYRQEGCFICHRLDGEGGKVGPDLTVEGTRGRSAEWLTGHFKNPAAYVHGSIMPSFDNLNDEQLQALTAFLMNQNGKNVTRRHTTE